MAFAYVGTSYHEVLQVPFRSQQPILAYGNKEKNQVNSIHYDPLLGLLSFSDPQAVTVFRVNEEAEPIRYDLQETFSNAQVKIIGNYVFNNRMYFMTNNGKIFSQGLEEKESNQRVHIVPALPKFGSSNFYRRATYNTQGETAFVGKGALPFLYSHENAVVTWRGSNVPNDHLDLEVPVDDVDCCFWKNDSRLAVANANDMVRIFDIRSKRRKPLSDLALKLNDNTKSRVSKLAVSEFGEYFYVAKENGSIYELDARKDCRPVSKFKGITSTVKDIKVTEKYLFSVSLDCFFRIFDREDKSLVYERYLNAHPTCLYVPQESLKTGDIFQVEECSQEEEQPEKPKKIKQIRKRNKVGLRYLQGQGEPDQAEVKEEGEVKLEGEAEGQRAGEEMSEESDEQ